MEAPRNPAKSLVHEERSLKTFMFWIEQIRLDMLIDVLLPLDNFLLFWSKTRFSPDKYIKPVFHYLLLKQSS